MSQEQAKEDFQKSEDLSSDDRPLIDPKTGEISLPNLIQKLTNKNPTKNRRGFEKV